MSNITNKKTKTQEVDQIDLQICREDMIISRKIEDMIKDEATQVIEWVEKINKESPELGFPKVKNNDQAILYALMFLKDALAENEIKKNKEV